MKFLQFTAVLFLFGSMIACKNAPKGDKATINDAAKVDTPVKTQAAAASTYKVQSGSVLNWSGAKVGGAHNGTINIQNGSFTINNGKISAGNFSVDMASLVSLDLEGEGKTKLEGHLKSPDFFDIATYPTSTFEVTKSAKLANDADATHLVSGNLKIKDATKEVSFKVKVAEAGNTVTVTSPDFTLDRTDFNVKYGSSKFFDNLKDKAINDNMGFSLNVTATK